MKSPQHLYIGHALFLFRRHEHPTLCWIVFVLELEESLQVQCSFAFSVCSLLLLDYCVCVIGALILKQRGVHGPLLK